MIPSLGNPDFLRQALAQVIGIACLFVGGRYVALIVSDMWKVTPWCAKDAPVGISFWKGPMFGAIEGIIYLSSMCYGRPEFITAWLAFKVVGRWHGLRDTASRSDRVRPREKAFEVYVLGSGLSLLNAGVAYMTTVLWRQGQEVLWVGLVGAAAVGVWRTHKWLHRAYDRIAANPEFLQCLGDGPCPKWPDCIR